VAVKAPFRDCSTLLPFPSDTATSKVIGNQPALGGYKAMEIMPISASKTSRNAKLGIPQAANFTLATIHVLANIFQLFILPLYLLPRGMWWSVTLVPIAALNNPFWAVIHETIHDTFNAASRINLIAGRVLSVFFGSPFHVLRLTHLSHHKFNRSPLEKGTEIYDPQKVSRFKANIRYYFYIVCGLYLLEVFSAFIFFLPRRRFLELAQRLVREGNIQEGWLAQKFMDDKRLHEIRMDGLAIALILGSSALCYRGRWMPFLSIIGARMFLISFMDNVYHYRTALNVTVSGSNFWVPRFAALSLLNFNLHRVHHANPSLPWTKLPEVFEHEPEKYDGNLLAAALAQFLGAIPAAQLEPHLPQTLNSDLKVSAVGGSRG
jgi:fatty acid desaturase